MGPVWQCRRISTLKQRGRKRKPWGGLGFRCGGCPVGVSEEILAPAGLSPRLLSAGRIGPRDPCRRGREEAQLPKKRARGQAAAGQSQTVCRVFRSRSWSAPLSSRPWCRGSSGRYPGEGSGSARGFHRGRTG